MKVNFIRKAMNYELIPQDEFIVEKTVEISERAFNKFINRPLDDYEFIRDNVNLMYCDKNNIYHCIFITTKNKDYGILVESEGYHYARYAAYLPKALIRSE